MTFYSDLAKDAHGLITEFGQSVTITRKTAGAYDPNTGTGADTTSTQTGKGVVFDYDARRIDGTQVAVGDKQLILSSIGITAPQVGDEVTVGSTVYTITAIKPLAPAGEVVIYEANLRGLA